MEIINSVVSKHKIVTDVVIRANYLKGKMAERAIQLAFQIKDSATQVRYYLESGAYRVFDFVHNNHFIEVKNSGTLRLTQQLKDMALLSKAQNGIFSIIVRANTHVPDSVKKWAAENGIEILNLLP